MNTEKIKNLFNNEDFVKELMNKNSAEEAQEFFEENGVQVALDDVKELGSVLEKIVKGEAAAADLERAANGELSEEDLANVAGGELGTLTVLGIAMLAGAIAGGGGTVGVLSWVNDWRW